MKRKIAILLAMAFTFISVGLVATPATAAPLDILGTWYVDTVGAPFKPHGMIFHLDGTMVLTNPDAAEAQNSSSAGYGSWQLKRNQVVGQFFEVNADKTTNQFTTLLIVKFTITSVTPDRFSGDATASYFDGDRHLVNGPFPATLLGQKFGVNSPVPDPV